MRRAIDGIASASEALFPENDLGAPTWKSTAMVERTLDWMNELEPGQRRLVTLLFIAVELGSILRIGRRFSRASVERRTSLVRAWRKSAFYPLKIVGESIKGALSMIYLSHADVLAYMGAYAVCAHPNDPLQLNVIPGALDQFTEAQ
jgi:hypothetical protein